VTVTLPNCVGTPCTSDVTCAVTFTVTDPESCSGADSGKSGMSQAERSTDEAAIMGRKNETRIEDLRAGSWRLDWHSASNAP
jgi:hypothetical protein